MPDRKTFTGIARRKQTTLAVRLGDIVSRWLITVGGIGTIIAVTAVFVFLAYVALPLFAPASSGQPRPVAAVQETMPWRFAIDEYGMLGWSLSREGWLTTFRPDTGDVLERKELFPKVKLTAACFSNDSPEVACGFADGNVRLGRIGFQSRFVEAAQLPEKLRNLSVGEPVTHDGGILIRTPEEQFRLQKVAVSFKDPVSAAPSAIALIDQVLQEGKSSFCVLTTDGKLLFNRVTERKNLLTDEVVLKTTKSELPFQPRPGSPPRHLVMTGQGESILLAWESGSAIRFDVRDVTQPVVAEELDLVADPKAKLTAIDLLIGRRTILVGDSAGTVAAWFGVRDDESSISDRVRLTMAHVMPGNWSGVRSLAASARTRLVSIGYDDGMARLYQVTSQRQLIETKTTDAPVEAVAIGAKDDKLYAVSKKQLWTADFDPRHPEASVKALFLPVWYEDYARHEHVWQSTGGTADFEPKMGLWPLVFGTLKATFYSMLFGAPLALLAAIYTSEFMHPRWRARVKPSVELMASLPSVVLGFLAGNIIAQQIEGVVPHVLTSFVTVPIALLFGAFLWQQIPQRRALLMQGWRFPLIALVIPLGILLGFALGSSVERWLFAGDIMKWLDGQIGGGFGGWMLLFLPLSALVTTLLVGSFVNPWLQRLGFATRGQLAMANLAKFVIATGTVVAIACAISGGLSGLGFDPRGQIGDTWIRASFVATFVQRNALVVGFIMGFAIIPIIYTIAEDALSTVPEHLRSASLGAGATPWQTALRIVVPTAMSGLFSAMMIGLGRAVGETMIVLMAAGNTPVLDLNIFDGFRTLSANIAVELPEAPRDSTHYRVLYLAALTLFVITFAINTVAETVRMRFRRRAYQL